MTKNKILSEYKSDVDVWRVWSNISKVMTHPV